MTGGGEPQKEQQSIKSRWYNMNKVFFFHYDFRAEYDPLGPWPHPSEKRVSYPKWNLKRETQAMG